MLRSFRFYSFLCIVFIFATDLNLQAQNALYFDGTNDYVQTPYAGIVGRANRTFEAWVNYDSSATSNMAIVDYGLNAVGSRNTFSITGSTGTLRFISGGTNANISSATNSVPPNQWTHVAFVLNNGTGFLYVNGVQVGTGSLTTVNTPTGNANLTIGQRVAGGSIPFRGAIDEVRVWNVARTQMEIQQTMNTELCSASGLVAYYSFNQGIAGGNNAGINTLPDRSGGGNNGSLINFALTGATSNWVTGAALTPSVGGMATISPIVCGSYTSPSGKYTWNSSNTYQDTITTPTGCDSIITINLTILNSSTSLLTDTACDMYSSPSGKYNWTSSGTYLDTLVNQQGCDSLITIELIINNPTSSTIAPTACESYTSPSGSFTWTASGVYQDVIPNSNGCDSTILVNLTILGTTSTTTFSTVCDSFISPSGRYIWKSSGTYLDTLINSQGCDSTLIIGLTINQSTNETRNEMACSSFTSPSGKYVWNATGTYLDTLTNANGCFDYLTVNLVITDIDTSVSRSGLDLMANASGLTYQWLDCQAGLSPIVGATGQQYSPLTSGSYAVEITENACKDTSSCFDVLGVNIYENQFAQKIELYPNPNHGSFAIKLGEIYPTVQVQLFDLTGKTILSKSFSRTSIIKIEEPHLAKGKYAVQVLAEEKQALLLIQIE